MKRKIITAILTALVLSTSCTAVKKERKQEKATSLEVSFNYQRQNDHGSNQYAVWIENESGDVVKTLFVTSFTAKGRARGDEKPVRGYIKRPYCVPNWVKAAKADNLSDQQIDAVSGATPQVSGLQTFTWDFTDQEGKKVEYGTYKVLSKPHYLTQVPSPTQAHLPFRASPASVSRSPPESLCPTRSIRTW